MSHSGATLVARANSRFRSKTEVKVCAEASVEAEAEAELKHELPPVLQQRPRELLPLLPQDTSGLSQAGEDPLEMHSQYETLAKVLEAPPGDRWETFSRASTNTDAPSCLAGRGF